MRTKSLLIGDVRFQFKYGFYFLYTIFVILYITIIYMLPDRWREQAAVIMIFTDPAAMGLYFMGAIVLFEKGERVLNSIAISPVKPYEYVISKLISIAIISTAAALLIGLGGRVISNYIYFITGVFLGSCLFSCIGIILAVNIKTLNQFIVATVPAEIIISVPAIAWLFGFMPRWLILHPGVCVIELCISGDYAFFAMIILLIWTSLFALFACSKVSKSLKSLGGVKL